VIPAPEKKKARVTAIREGELGLKEEIIDFETADGQTTADVSRDSAKACMLYLPP
jgi:hypothetical protein